MVNVTFKNKVFNVKKNTTIADFLKENDAKFLDVACCAQFNNSLKDLRDCLNCDGVLNVLTFEDEQGKNVFWHTTAHILAQALTIVFKDVRLGIGPAIENGFFYDVVTNPKISTLDFEKIEAEMKKIVAKNYEITREFISYEEAKKLFEKTSQKYKLELIEDLHEKNKQISIYKQGDFFDLCLGPHILSTSSVKAIKLLNLTGAYWKGDAKNEMLDRVYGISFREEKELKNYVFQIEQAKKRDHRKLGKDLELFTFLEEGPGFCFFMPKGVAVKNALISFWRKEHEKEGYEEIMTPTILSKSLWETSGHWQHYKENMYITKIDDCEFAIKPMNCPGSILAYKTKKHSYKELPIKFAELGTVHRHELSGTLHGLMRARCFTQDDAHIFLTKDQIKTQVYEIIKLIGRIYNKFGFEYSLVLATMPEDHVGEEKEWQEATQSLKEAIESAELSYLVNEGDGAFYGPKIDFYLKDCLNRSWQCGTIQLDFQLPQRFSLEYVGQDGEVHMPIMIHRVVYGSIERFIGILTEHFAGAFPFFIAPVQVIVVVVSNKFLEYAKAVKDNLAANGFRVEIDERDEKLGYKIRQAQIRKIPFLAVIGEKEVLEQTVSVRKYKEKTTKTLKLQDFVVLLKQN